MKHILLWTSICALVPLTFIAVQGNASPSSAETPVPTATTTPTAVVPISTTVRAADGATMVYVPAGEFLMGSLEEDGDPDEHPQHKVTLDAFWIDRTEVTNRQFEQFVRATGYRTDAEKEGVGGVWPGYGPIPHTAKGADWRHPEGPGSDIAQRADYPVVQVSWDDAQAYCQWAGAHLPTEAQWEKAARGADAREYPWGNQRLTCQYAVMADKSGEGCGRGKMPWPVGSKPEGASPYGALDMAGNVWEWVADWFRADYYAHSPADNPQGPDQAIDKTNRGGSWADAESDWQHRTAVRGFNPPTDGDNTMGFRCAMPAAAAAGAVTTPTAVATSSAKLPGRVLFIGDGNSWFLEYFTKLAASASPPMAVEAKVVSVGGASLGLNWLNPTAPDAIREGNWDVVVLEEDLGDRWPDGVASFQANARKFDEAIKQVGAETMLYMPWPDRGVKSPTFEDIATAYLKSGTELGAEVVPAGLAFQRSLREHPEFDLYAEDGDHPSPDGAYLALCTFYGSLFESSPVGLEYRMEGMPARAPLGSGWGSLEGWQLTDDEATFLQQIAWDTVQEYRAGE